MRKTNEAYKKIEVGDQVIIKRNKKLNFSNYQWGEIVEDINSYLFEVYDEDDIFRLTEDDFIYPSGTEHLSILKNRPNKRNEKIMKNKIVKIKEDVRIGNIILEKGDRIKVFENNSIIGKVIFFGSPGYELNVFITNVEKTKDGWEISFNDDSFTTVSNSLYNELVDLIDNKSGEINGINSSSGGMGGAHISFYL